MKIKQMALWNLRASYINIVAMYGILLALYVLTGVVNAATAEGKWSVNINGTMLVSAVMMLVLGIVLFSQSLLIGLGNGVSRRSVFGGFLVFSAVAAAIMTVAGTVLEQAGSLIKGVSIHGLTDMFAGYQREHGWLAASLAVLVCTLVIHIAVGLIGYFIGGAYYRMNKAVKIGVSVGVPACVLIGLPMGIASLSESARETVWRVTRAIGLFVTRTPYHLAMLFLVIALLSGGAAWLLIRRAPAKAVF